MPLWIKQCDCEHMIQITLKHRGYKQIFSQFVDDQVSQKTESGTRENTDWFRAGSFGSFGKWSQKQP